MYKITAIGEALIDFTPANINGTPAFLQNPGGGPPNLLTAAVRQGAKTAFIGMVGQDAFGHYLQGVLDSYGVYTGGMRYTARAQTPLAFVHLAASGERSFSFYRSPGADTQLSKTDIDEEILLSSEILHISSLSFTNEPARTAVLWAAEFMRAHGRIVSFDPNYRASLWKSPEEAVKHIQKGIARADFLKVSEEELLLITGIEDPSLGAAQLLEKGPSLVAVSLGEKGSFFKTAKAEGYAPPFKAAAIDTTGAGDAFWGTLLARIDARRVAELSNKELQSVFLHANAAGSLCTQVKGGMPAMPSREQVEELVKRGH